MRKFNSKDDALDYLLHQIVWGNAAGTCKDASTAKMFAQASMPTVMFGSITAQPRAGNPGDNFYWDPETGNSINALGLPNQGLEAYLKVLPGIKRAVNDLGSKLWVSISAGDKFSAKEYHDMTRSLIETKAADVVEGNFSCPNVEVGGKRKPVVCFDEEAFLEGVAAMWEAANGTVPLAVKIAPITEARMLGDLIGICVEHNVDYVVGANTVGNCYMESAPGKPAITMKRGGGAGAMLRPVIRGMTQMAATQLKGKRTKFIAVGGIETGRHAYNILCDGAHGFAFNTALSRNGNDPKVVEDMIFGYKEEPGLLELLYENGLPN